MGSPWWTEKMNRNEPFTALAVTQEHVLLQCLVMPCQKQDHRLEFFYFSSIYLFYIYIVLHDFILYFLYIFLFIFILYLFCIFYIYIVLHDLKKKLLFVEFELHSLQVDERCNNR